MGYYSDWTVEVSGDFYSDLATVLEDYLPGGYWYALDDNQAQLSEARWYDYAEHMETLSKDYRAADFLLTRISEDGERNGRELWRNGRVVKRYHQEWVEDDG